MGSVALEGFGGGGGAALNFKVVPGLTQPGTAAENTIWVKTEKIGTWYFSATQPEGMQEWDVWFTISASSAVEFNALKKNGIQVYPISAKQYVSGAWVNKEAKSYQNGEWGEWWNGELYTPGNEWNSVTGGWVTKGFVPDGSFSGVTMNKTAGSNTIVFTRNFSQKQGSSVQPESLIDVTDFDTLNLDMSISTTAECTANMIIENEKGNGVSTTTLINGNSSYNKVGYFNLSGISGKCRILIAVWSWDYTQPTITVTIRNAKLS